MGHRRGFSGRQDGVKIAQGRVSGLRWRRDQQLAERVIDLIVSLVIVVGLVAYLVAALIRPDSF